MDRRQAMENQRIGTPLRAMTKNQWRHEGRGIKRDAYAARFVKCDGRYVALYPETETTKLRPYTVSRNFLLDLFVGYPETFGYLPKGGDCIYRPKWQPLEGIEQGLIARRLIERGFDYRRCAAGIPIEKYRAESFHVPTPAYTRFAVVDLDNHAPSRRSTEIHLELVQRLQQRLPELARRIGLKSSFWQYRCIEPTGVQLWLVTTGERFRRHLHANVREFLRSLDDGDLDERLRSCGLPGLADIEILPSEKLISMPGCYGKLVFTDHELKIKNQKFDCESLHKHIEGRKQAGDVYDRYRELVLVRDFSDEPESQAPPPTAVSQKSFDTNSNLGNGHWSKLKFTCLHGIDQPDQLHELFLKPVAQALLFREFHDHKDKKELAVQALKKWVFKKHNGLVSRINDGKHHLVESQIRSTIKNIIKTPNEKILDLYSRIRLNDLRFPDKKESLLPYMEADNSPFFLLDCKGCFSEQEKRQPNHGARQRELSELPVRVSERLQQYAETHMRVGRATERFLGFARAFIAKIGFGGEGQINEQTLLRLAGREPDCDTSFLKEWKKHLVHAGILRKGWERNIIRGLRSSLYQVQPWVKEELDAMSSSCGPDGRPVPPAKA